MEFNQPSPEIGNQYLEDSALRNYLKVLVPESVMKSINNDLEQLGHKVATEYLEMAHQAEDNKPYLVKYDAYGKRIDEVKTNEGWRFFKPEAAKEGLIAIPYENQYAQYSRIYQVIKLYLFAPSSGLFSCPMAMSDGAAYTLRELSKTPGVENTPEMKEAYEHLTSRDPKQFWKSGQWMTEKRGKFSILTISFINYILC